MRFGVGSRLVLVSAFPDEEGAPHGGVEASTLCLAQGLSNLGIRPRVVVPSSRSGSEAFDCGDVVRVAVARSVLHNARERLEAVSRAVAEMSPRLVHVQGDANLAWGLRRALHVPVVLTIHGIPEVDAWRASRISMKLRAPVIAVRDGVPRRFAPNVIAISEYSLRASRGRHRRIWRIPNPIMDGFFERPTIGIHRPLRILYVGRLLTLKNVEGLVRAVTQELGSRSDWELRIVGPEDEPGYKAKCESAAGGFLGGGRISFVGGLGVREVVAEYQNADIFVLPSLQENAPLVVAQAQASGMPVVATDVGSVAGMLSGYEDGFLVKPGDERGLASALQRALDRVSRPGYARGSTPDGVLAQHPVAVARATLAAYGEVEMQSLERSERRRRGSVDRE